MSSSSADLPVGQDWCGLPRDAALRALALDEQLRAIVANAALAVGVALSFALVLAWAMHESLSRAELQAWVALRLVLAVLRMLTLRQLPPAPALVGDKAYRTVLGLLALDALVWGLGGAWLMGGPESRAALVGAALACIACVATFGLQISLQATLTYVLPMLLLPAAALSVRGDSFGLIGAAGLTAVGLLSTITAARSQGRLLAGIRLRQEAQRLAQEKDQALRLALRQSAARTQFMGNVSHELRTPLHGILGLARLLHMDLTDAAQRRRIELIEVSGRHLMTLINDLIDLSRIEAGNFPLHDSCFDLAALLQQVVEVHTVRAAEKGLAFEHTLDLPEPCWVRGDPARVRQVLYNLLGNAIKFTPRGRVSLRVQHEAAHGRLLAEVVDTGPGIPAADQARIFEAFQQAGIDPARPQEGAGLGLKIARELAMAMGGQLSVRSVAGQGASFSFTARLPLGEPEPGQGLPLLLQQGQTPALRALRVLVAEDDEVNAMIVIAALQQMRIEVERVADGRQAVQRALSQAERPDLLLMDCRMPVLDGYAATREIRAQERLLGLPRLPIIALTATVTELGRSQCQEAGMDDFIAKPFSPAQLEAALQAWLGRAPPPVGLSEGDGR